MNSRGPFLATRSGVKWYPMDPRPEDVRIEDIAHALSMIPRFNGHSLFPYSVASHSLHVASLVSDACRLEALLHDAAEAYCCDVPSPLRRCLPDYNTLIAKAERAVAHCFGLSDAHHDEIKRADLIALATEARDLFPDHDLTEWSLTDIRDTARIVPMDPDFVHMQFMVRFMELRR